MLNITEKADELYSSYKIQELYDYLHEHKEVLNDEIQWRLARVTHDRAKHEKDKHKRHNSMLEAFSYAEKALQLNSNSPHCHRWYGALLHFTTEGIGLKNKIHTAYKVREHFDKALELDPEDAISLHSIGYWCFVFAERPWYQRKIASALFEALPETTYDEALEWFLKAEKIKENFMCTNILMIGKTYMRLHNKEKAVEFLQKTLEFKIMTPDDEQSHKEAEEMLKHLGHGHLLKSCLHVDAS
ncbi:regulator of microtubule dynamics protein 1-like [Physella acuta]|uniref:regulator of microtubule dynamics protein 1-like n=1 Tax=Physella acuta TaxID=109671 RepID=UPI0027DAD29E|nr:regulator of microtubule dynamics protein 1-like [Physella acuta]